VRLSAKAMRIKRSGSDTFARTSMVTGVLPVQLPNRRGGLGGASCTTITTFTSHLSAHGSKPLQSVASRSTPAALSSERAVEAVVYQ
jgi:hypothetical protein